MKNEALIRESLLYKNRDNFEQSECVGCEVGARVPGCEWKSLNVSASMTRPGIPIYLNENGNVLMTDFSHTTIIGSTGTGKSEVIVKNYLQIMALADSKEKPSFLASDLKGDISADLANYLEKRGYTVITMDMKRPYQSKRYNFMTQIYDDYHEAHRIKCALEEKTVTAEFDGVTYKSVTEARNAANAKALTLIDSVEKAITELANIIIVCTDAKDATWFTGARTMFCAIVLTMLHDSENPKNGVTREKFTIANVCRAAFTTENDCETIISWLRRAESNLTVQNAVMGNYDLRAKVTRDGYISTLNTALSAYTSNAISVLTSTSDDIDLREVATRDKPYAIFLITDDRQKITNSISMMLVNNLLAELTSYADKCGGRALKRDFVFLLDEFCNMPPLPDMSNKITTLRSRRVWLVMAIQSIQQLRQVYGEDTAEIIIDNCDISLFLGSNNFSTKKIFADSMGQKMGIYSAYNKDNFGNTSENISSNNAPVIKLSDLDALSLGEFFVRTRTHGNLKSSMTPYFRRADVTRGNGGERPAKFRAFDPADNIYKMQDTLDREEKEAGPKRRKFDFDF